MDLGLDRAIERLNALKLHTPATASAPPATPSNQRDHHHHETAALQDQYARLAQEMQDHYERQLREQAARLEQQHESLRREAETLRAQVADQHTHIELLQSEVKQLRVTNYRLQYMVQQNDRTRGLGGLPPPPPDIF